MLQPPHRVGDKTKTVDVQPFLAHAWPLLCAPLPAVLIGTLVMNKAQVPSSIWVQNPVVPIAMEVLCAVALFAPRLPFCRAPVAGIAMIAALLMTATLFDEGLQSVRRWLMVGPFRINAGAVCLPILVIATGQLFRECRVWTAAAVFLILLALLVAQPDASAATAFALASLVLIRLNELSRRQRTFLAVFGGILLISAWARFDPLGRVVRVVYVEDIVELAGEQGVTWAVAAVIALCLVPLPFLISGAKSLEHAAEAYALAVFFAVSSAARLTGNFPVPFLGYGASPIIG